MIHKSEVYRLKVVSEDLKSLMKQYPVVSNSVNEIDLLTLQQAIDGVDDGKQIDRKTLIPLYNKLVDLRVMTYQTNKSIAFSILNLTSTLWGIVKRKESVEK
jgi:hypothetical protein